MKIAVEHNDLPTEVGVTVKENGVVMWCNHALTSIGRHDVGWEEERVESLEYCLRCEAWRYTGSQEWL